MVEITMPSMAELRKLLDGEQGADLLGELVRRTVNALMSAEADAICGAAHGERSPERINSRNGYRSREWDTRAGTLELEIPKLRRGSYFPTTILEPRRRSEQAVVAAVADMYLAGVSTRRVDKLVQQLGIDSISKSQVSRLAATLDAEVEAFRNRPLDASPYPYLMLDALVVKVREAGRVVNTCVVHAVGVNRDGRRETLGLDIVTAEDEASWTSFLRSLVGRGLDGVQLVTSDCHAGLVEAIRRCLPGASWQRCRTHFARNLLTRVPKAEQPAAATLVRSIFAQADVDSVRQQHARIVDQLAERYPAAADLLDAAGDDLLAFTAMPKEVWRQVWSTNPPKRLNRELRRRTDVVGIFPHRAAAIRLIGALLAEQGDEWADADRRYFSLDAMTKTLTLIHPDTPEVPMLAA